MVETRAPLRRRLRGRSLDLLAQCARIPGARVALRGGLTLVAAGARFAPSERVTLANLERALGAELGPRERRRIAAGVRRHAARIAGEWLRIAHRGDVRGPAGAWIEREVEVDDSIAHLRALHDAGRGVLVVTAHLGNWEYLSARLRREGLDGVVVGRHRARDGASDWLCAMRRGYGVTTFPQDGSARELLAVLGRGETIGMLADLEVRRLDGIFVPFFGVPALTMSAPAALARARGIPLLPARCVARSPHPESGYRLSFEAPLALDPQLPREQAARELLARLNEVYERWIRADPEQWAWHQPRWRTREGEFDAVPLAARARRANG